MAFPDIQTAAAQLESEKSSAAIRLLNELVTHFPTYSTAHLLLARAHRMEGNRAAALQALAQARLWSSVPASIDRELRTIVDDAFHAAPESSEPQQRSSEDGGSALPDEAREALDLHVSTSRGTQPEDLEEDLRERLGPPEETPDEDIKDLDSLIQRLEGARIQPEPDVGPSGPVDDDEAGETDDNVVSETLARIYAAQKEYRAAMETYLELAEQYPERSDEYRQKARELEEKL